MIGQTRIAPQTGSNIFPFCLQTISYSNDYQGPHSSEERVLTKLIENTQVSIVF